MTTTSKGASLRRALLLMMVAALSVVIALPSASAHRSAGGKAPRGKTYVIDAAAGPAAPVTWQWDPEDIQINAGDTIRWENATDTAHTVRPWEKGGFGAVPWGAEYELEPGDSANFRFTKAGVYLFRCGIEFHSDVWYLGDDQGTCTGMCGSINVAG